MQGRVAGVQMTTNNGEPGGGVQVRIRGGTSIRASNDPLYVIDGVPLQNESPVAGAMINGVNAALPAQPAQLDQPERHRVDHGAEGRLGDRHLRQPRRQRRRPDPDQARSRAAARRSSTTRTSPASIAARHLDFLDGDQYRTFVQQQVAAGKLPATQPALTARRTRTGRSALTAHRLRARTTTSPSRAAPQQTNYRASLNYFDQQGVVIDNGLKRYQGRLNGHTRRSTASSASTLNLTASRVNNDYLAMENGGGFTGGVFTNVAIYNPTLPVHVLDPATGQTKLLRDRRRRAGVRNPVALAKQITDRAPENRILGNVTGTLTLMTA